MPLRYRFLSPFLLSSFLVASVEAAGPLTVYPETIELTGRDSRQQVIVSVSAGRFTGDVTREATFEVADADVASVDRSGVVTPLKSGATQLTVKHQNLTATVQVKVASGDTDLPLDFGRDIVPILTRRGCNGGGCHGKTTGRGGFRLSLFGYNPNLDFESITRDSAGRRVTTHRGAASLLLQKPAMRVPHGGGKRLASDEPEFARLVRWIEGNAPRTLPGDAEPAELEKLTLEPSQRSLRPESQQQVVATAHYSDGSTRDVTRLVVFKSNESTIAEVDDWGLVTTAKRIGETAVVATFSGQVAVSRIRIPLDRPWTEPDFPIRNTVDELVLAQLKSLGIPPSEV
nr:Ig-like domain-containing protein [Planctomycetota bacterium]